MQSPTATPRDELTEAQVVGLIRDSSALIVGHGAELLDMNLGVLADISGDLAGGSVSRNARATLHGTAKLAISTELDWGSALVRPYYTISDGTLSARFNLGAYFTSVPRRHIGEIPPTYEVDGFDILLALADSPGDAYTVDAGFSYLTAVEAILAERGLTQHLIDRTAAGRVLPSPTVWPLDQSTTWLTIVNDLLAAIGYAGVWSDWNGRLRCQPYQSPRARRVEWTYDVDLATSMLGAKRTVERDYFDAPNRWVFYRTNNVDGPAPVEGDGRFTYTNQHDGDTSVTARGGRVITKVEGLDVADHASLVEQAQSIIDADRSVPSTMSVPTSPNPLHWHFDRLLLNDPAFGLGVDALGTQWTLPFGGGDMSHGWDVL